MIFSKLTRTATPIKTYDYRRRSLLLRPPLHFGRMPENKAFTPRLRQALDRFRLSSRLTLFHRCDIFHYDYIRLMGEVTASHLISLIVPLLPRHRARLRRGRAAISRILHRHLCDAHFVSATKMQPPSRARFDIFPMKARQGKRDK